MSDTHQERSRLVNEYKTQLRSLQKSLKKKKLPQKQKEEVEQQIEELERKYEADLKEFDALHGVEVSKKKAGFDDKSDNPQSVPHSSEPPGDSSGFLTSRNWGGLSKKELEDCCVNRGLSRKGAKEQLISRLTIWSVSQGHNPQNAADLDVNEIQYETFNPVNVVVNSAAKKDEFREKRKKLWKRRSAGPAREGPAESDESSDSHSDSDSDEGSSEVKQSSGKGKRVGDQPDSDIEVDSETLQKQRKREAVVATVVGRILQKYKSGVKLSEISDKLKEFKVANFTPQLLGYDSLEEWIEGQPKSLLTYKSKTQLILPSIVGAMPDSDESDEEESD